MKNNNSPLKKHSFWILLGLVPLFVLIAALVVTSSVGGAIDTRTADIDKSKKDIASKQNPKPYKLVTALGEMVELVKKKKTSLWEENWDRQKSLYTWPKEEHLKKIEGMNLKFGAKIPDEDFTYDKFKDKEFYLAEYSNADLKTGLNPRTGKPGTGMADTIAPTQFLGGWDKVLRHVNAWGTAQLTSEQIWLIMEDLWVQRSMLDAVRSVNAQMGEFRRVKFERDGKVIDDPADPNLDSKLRRRFESRTWVVELEAKQKDNKWLLTGRLINRTNRLQVMGLGNTMTLRVWLNNESPPVDFRIGGEFLPGEGAMRRIKVLKNGKETGEELTVPANVIDVAPLPDQPLKDYPNVLPAGPQPVEIVKVEQVFDIRTVPVRRIDALQLVLRDSRFSFSELKMPDFPAFAVKEGDTATGANTASSGGPGSAVGPPMGMPMGGSPGGFGTGTASGSSTAARAGGGPIEAVVNGNKKRYVDLTQNVRRMPVGIVVVVDQAYLQDVLLAFANSPLRFQITQVTWKRFRGQLDGLGTGSASDIGGAGGVVSSGKGDTGMEFNTGESGRPPLGPVGIRPGGGGSGLVSPGMVGGPTGTGMYGPGMYGSGGGSLTTVSESQLTSGLIELSVYGIVSLYEKYSADADTAKDGKDPKDTKDPKDMKDPKDSKEPKDTKDSKEPEPKDKVPDPKMPMTPDPKTPKMRRRVR